MQDFRVFQTVGQLLGTSLAFLDQPDLDAVLQQLGHTASDQAAPDNHDPVEVLLFDTDRLVRANISVAFSFQVNRVVEGIHDAPRVSSLFKK